MKAAAEEFEARGYQGTRLQDVVAGQTVSKGALYFHFSSKEKLAAAVIREQHDLLAELAARLRPRYPQPVRLLIEMSRQVVILLSDNSTTRAGTRLSCERDQIGSAAPNLFDAWAATVTGLLDEAKAQGDVPPGIDSRNVAEFIIAAVAGTHRRVRSGETDLSLHGLVTTMWQVLLPGLAAPGRQAEIMTYLDTVDDAT